MGGSIGLTWFCTSISTCDMFAAVCCPSAPQPCACLLLPSVCTTRVSLDKQIGMPALLQMRGNRLKQPSLRNSTSDQCFAVPVSLSKYLVSQFRVNGKVIVQRLAIQPSRQNSNLRPCCTL